MIHTARCIALGEHGCTLFFEALLCAVVQGRYAWQRHDQGQALAQGNFVGAF